MDNFFAKIQPKQMWSSRCWRAILL